MNDEKELNNLNDENEIEISWWSCLKIGFFGYIGVKIASLLFKIIYYLLLYAMYKNGGIDYNPLANIF